MTGSYVPSLREYAANYQIDGRRLGAGQLLMHPGPVNRGVELVVRGDRLAAGADHPAGRVGGGGQDGRPLRAPRRRRERPLPPRPSPRPSRWEPRDAAALRRRRRSTGPRRRPGTSSSAARGWSIRAPASTSVSDIVLRDGEVAEIGDSLARAGGRRGDRRRRPRGRPGVRRSARPPAHARAARTRRTSTRARAPRPPAASARSSRSRTPTRSWTTARSCPRCASARARRRGSRQASSRRSRSARRATRSPRWRSSPRSARRASPTTAAPSRARASCARRSSTSGSPGRLIALHEEDPSLSRDGVMHEGAVSALLGMAGIPSISESTMIARDAQIALYEDAAIHIQHLSARESVDGGRAGEGGRGRDHLRGEPAPPLPDRRGRALARRRLQDEPAAALRGRPPGADRRAALGRDRLRRHRPRAARARGEGAAVRGRADGGDRARDRVRRAAHRAGGAGHPRPRAAGRADDRRRRAVRAAGADARAGLAGQRDAARPRRRVAGGGGGLREPLRQLRVRRART